MNSAAEEIRNRVTMCDAAQKYGYTPNERGFICCPFHHEKTASLKLFPGGRGFHCFGCGANGDVIDFTERVFGLDFTKACKKLSEDFGLELFKRLSPRERTENARKQRELKAQQTAHEREKQCAVDEYEAALTEWLRLDGLRRDFAPKRGEMELKPEYVEYLQKISWARYVLSYKDTTLSLIVNGGGND